MSRRPFVFVSVLVLACDPASSSEDPPPKQPAAEEPSTSEPALPKISEDPVVQELVRVGLRESEVEAHTRHLTRVIGPRLSSSHALMEAERWAQERFASYGLDARLEHWGDYPVGFDRGPASGGMVSPEAIAYDFTTPAWTPGISGPARAPAQLMPQTVAELDQRRTQLEGAWIVVPPPAGRQEMDGDVLKRLEGELDELGALGYIAADRDGELVHTWGRHEIDWAALPSQVRVQLRGDQHAALVERLRAGGQAVELEFAIDNRFFRGPVRQHNVIADLVGSELPDEVVIVGGHLDSWDGSEGAVDNASGVATTLEAARLLHLAGAKPRRTIRFMLWGGEEQGLFGSQAYVDENPDLMDNISAVLVHDGGTNYLSGLTVTPEMHAQLSGLLEPLTKLAPETMPFELSLTDHLRPGSSDHDSFLRAGVPGFFWLQEGRSQYRCMHHTQLDVFEAVIDEYQRHSAVVVAVAALQLANAAALVERSNALPEHQRELDAEHDWAVIEAVPEQGHAREAGLRVGDVITSVDGEAVSTSSRVRQLLNRGEPKKVLAILRGKRSFELTIDFSDDPSEQAAIALRAERIERFGDDIFERIAADQAQIEEYGDYGEEGPPPCTAELEAARERGQVP